MIHQALSPGGVDWLPPLILIDLIISVYLSSLPVAHMSDAPRRRLVVTVGAMIHQALSPGGVDWLPPLILLRV